MTETNSTADTENVWIDFLENDYERITDGTEIVYMHQLEALKDNSGYEVFDDSNQCHHRNKQRWDNREENIDLMSNNHHDLLHNRGEWTEADGEPIWDIASTNVTSYGNSD